MKILEVPFWIDEYENPRDTYIGMAMLYFDSEGLIVTRITGAKPVKRLNIWDSLAWAHPAPQVADIFRVPLFWFQMIYNGKRTT